MGQASKNTSVSEGLTIGALAKAAGVGVETIRFYERKKLIEQPAKETGFRTYSPGDVKKIKFIKRAQELGFTLSEAKSLMELKTCSVETSPQIRKITEEKMEEVEAKIKNLNQMLLALKTFANTCGHKHDVSAQDCGLLDCFENHWECC